MTAAAGTNPLSTTSVPHEAGTSSWNQPSSAGVAPSSAYVGDSAYLVNAFRQSWISRWQVNGWRTAANKPVENQDLWRDLLALASRHEVEWLKVKGHGDNIYNARCDKLARQAIPFSG